jgi:hypothetical protein
LNVNAHQNFSPAKAQSAAAFLKLSLRLCGRTFFLLSFVQSSFMIGRNGSRKIIEYATHLNTTLELVKWNFFCRTTRHAMPAARREVTTRR